MFTCRTANAAEEIATDSFQICVYPFLHNRNLQLQVNSHLHVLDCTVIVTFDRLHLSASPQGRGIL